MEPASTPRPLVQEKLWEILYLLICSFLPCLSWLLRSRVRKSRRDLWITLYLRSCLIISSHQALFAIVACVPHSLLNSHSTWSPAGCNKIILPPSMSTLC
jgi:4-amino-4-deoxy-L-arabinose transferase-like glycosyltransferase